MTDACHDGQHATCCGVDGDGWPCGCACHVDEGGRRPAMPGRRTLTALERIAAALEHARGACKGRAIQLDLDEALDLARSLVRAERGKAGAA